MSRIMAQLGKICTVVSGATPRTDISEYWNGDIKWITPAEISSDCYYISESERHISTLAVQKTGLTVLPEGTVILSSRAPIGKTAIAGCNLYCNQGFKNLICGNKIDNRYLYFFLSSKTEYLNSLGRGATFKEISKAIVEKIEIPLPSISEQQDDVSRLEILRTLIVSQKEQLSKLDDLVKSRFLEMFGDPVSNEKGFETRVGADCFKLSNGKFVPESKRFSAGVPAYGGNGVSWHTDDVLFEGDTIVVGRVGFQSGNVHLVKGPLWVTDNAMYISQFIGRRYDLVFLIALMGHIDFTRYQDAGDLKKITQKPFMEMRFIYPPIEQQEQFAAFVAQVDKSKLAVQQSLSKLETLKKSLMQKYFG